MTTVPNNDTHYYFTLSISYSDCRSLYQSARQSVILTSESGQRIQIPTVRLKAFIDSRGLSGRFRLVVSAQNKIKSFDRLR